jgi:deoxyribodipyrimidine photo-lyase
MTNKVTIFWFRRDLRLEDNASLWAALKSGNPVLPIFIFDKNILDKLENRQDARVTFIYNQLVRLNSELNKFGSSLRVFYSTPKEVYAQLATEMNIAQVWANRDYEPYAQQRDQDIYAFLKSKNIEFKGLKDHVIFEKDEVLKDDGKPYTIYTPYSRKWKTLLKPFHYKAYPTLSYSHNFIQLKDSKIPTLNEMGFDISTLEFPNQEINVPIISKYELTRDIPSIRGTTRLSLHLRFGTISIRHLVEVALKTSEKWLNELIWRDFYQMIIFHFPYTVDGAFKPAYDRIEWENNVELFDKWCKGKTGYPIVDAGMRELNETGFMHNRVRMVVASFLTKHLLIDWKWGERYFAEKLLDFELASNIGGWQWAAGCGCDAAPYFRIFNPTSQMEKFDKEKKYIRRWVPEYGTPLYSKPIVDHVFARNRCLDVFKKALKEQ